MVGSVLDEESMLPNASTIVGEALLTAMMLCLGPNPKPYIKP